MQYEAELLPSHSKMKELEDDILKEVRIALARQDAMQLHMIAVQARLADLACTGCISRWISFVVLQRYLPDMLCCNHDCCSSTKA